MKKIKYFIGFVIGVLFVYIVGSLVGWDLNPGQWNGFWRFWCVVWALGWGHLFGVFIKDRVKKNNN
jgi:hypothetical protein